MGLPGKIEKKAWAFPSSSGSKTYQAILYTDGTTSCNCRGWTRRVAPDGSRSCKHTKFIEMGIADQECVGTPVEYGQDAPAQTQAAPAKKPDSKPKKPSKKKAKQEPIKGPVVRKLIRIKKD